MIDDVINSVRRHLSDRLVSPLMGSFVLCWAVWNYKFVLIALSTAPLAERLALIGQEVFPDGRTTWWNGVWIPMCGSLVYVFLYPWPARWTYHYAKWQQKALLQVRRKLEDETPLTVEESRAIRSEMVKREGELAAELDRRDREVQSLKQRIVSLETDQREFQRDKQMQQTPGQEGVIEDDWARVLAAIEGADSGDGVEEKRILQSIGIKRTQAKVLLTEMVEAGMLERQFVSGTSDCYYTATTAGRRTLLRWQEKQGKSDQAQ